MQASRPNSGSALFVRPWRRFHFRRISLATLHLGLAILLVASSATSARAQASIFRRAGSARTTPHPAVARITVDEGDTTSHGSGSLIDVRDNYGLVLTNWHVISEAQRSIVVSFPGGFESAARILHQDADWDLAALLIWRPPIDPLPVAGSVPQPGETVTIAGYGSGKYRASSGRLTQYVSPGEKFPYEMIEVSTEARQGDSGGPMINQRGEMVGVLFGAGGGTTSGSHALRVRQFLSSAWARGVTPSPIAPADTYVATNDLQADTGLMQPVDSAPPAAIETTAAGGSQQPAGSNDIRQPIAALAAPNGAIPNGALLNGAEAGPDLLAKADLSVDLRSASPRMLRSTQATRDRTDTRFYYQAPAQTQLTSPAVGPTDRAGASHAVAYAAPSTTTGRHAVGKQIEQLTSGDILDQAKTLLACLGFVVVVYKVISMASPSDE